MTFRDLYGEIVCLDVEIPKVFGRDKDRTIYVATDSKVYKGEKGVTKFATVVVLRSENCKGRIYVRRYITKESVPLNMRLRDEVWRSLETAFLLDDIKDLNSKIIIHVDCNSSLKYKSGKYKDEFVGMVVGQGFDCEVKPNAWAAQTVADRLSR